MQHQWGADDLPDGLARVEGGVGVLEDDLHVAAHFAQSFGTEVGKVLTAEVHRAGIGFNQPKDAAPGGGLAAA